MSSIMMQKQVASAFGEIKKTGMCSTHNAGVIFSSAKPKMDGGWEPFHTEAKTTPPTKTEMPGQSNDGPAQFSPFNPPAATNTDDISDESQDCDMNNAQNDAEFNRWLDEEINDTAEALSEQCTDTTSPKSARRGGNAKQRLKSYKKRLFFRRALAHSKSKLTKLQQEKGGKTSSFTQKGVKKDPKTAGKYYERVRNEHWNGRNGKYMKIEKRDC